jgi:UPF0755 protein
MQNSKIIIIKPNLKISAIAYTLEENNIIKYRKLFTLLAKIYSLKYPLKSGEYNFTANISPIQILRILYNGKSIIHKIIVPEGVYVHEIIEMINKEERLFGNVINNVPEGFLMPNTYFFSYGDMKEKLIEQMRNLMSYNLDNIMKKLDNSSPLKTRLDVLILASIVEKETNSNIERPVIASVFLNRLKKNMKLQADPTTIYAITEGKYKLTRNITKKDLSIESHYNTYYVNGLPKGPISCPSLKSLEAVASPANSKFLYFVVSPAGGHAFAENINDHNINVQIYRESLKNLSKNEF